MNNILEINDKKEENDTKYAENNEKYSEKTQKRRKNIIRSLAVATAILGVTTIGFAIGYGIEKNNADEYKSELSNVYNSNFYSLLDSVNNLENKLTKTLNASSSTYQRKTLLEASKNASEAEIAVASLPFNQYEVEQTIKMVNQISGYTSTLADKLSDGRLSEEDYQSLSEIHTAVSALQQDLNDMARKLNNGYSILEASREKVEDSQEFSLSTFKDNDVQYPSMIYDGPFSDSVVDSQVKGLVGKRFQKRKHRKTCKKTLRILRALNMRVKQPESLKHTTFVLQTQKMKLFLCK